MLNAYRRNYGPDTIATPTNLYIRKPGAAPDADVAFGIAFNSPLPPSVRTVWTNAYNLGEGGLIQDDASLIDVASAFRNTELWLRANGYGSAASPRWQLAISEEQSKTLSANNYWGVPVANVIDAVEAERTNRSKGSPPPKCRRTRRTA